MLDNPFSFVPGTHHESSDILQINKWSARLVAELNELRCFHSTLGKKYTVVPQYTYRVAIDMRMAGNQGWTIVALELQELGTINDARNDFAHIERDTRISWNHTQQLFCVIVGLHRAPAATCKSLLRIEMGHDLASYTNCIPIICRCVVADT